MKAGTACLILLSLIIIANGEIQSIFKRTAGNVHCHCVNHGNGGADLKYIRSFVKILDKKLDNVLKKLNDFVPGVLTNCNEPRNCAEVLKCCEKNSGVYRINPDGKGAFKVYCDQKSNGGGWTVFQRRQDGSVNFYRGWDEYKNGFGDLKGEFWLGLDKINRLTHQTRNRLRVDLQDHKGNNRYAEYDYFAVADEKNKYRLSLGNYTGTAADSLSSRHQGKPFSTKDRDNDSRGSGNCAVMRKGAWWFNQCQSSHLNGVYYQAAAKVPFAEGINWYHWKGDHYSLKKAQMKFRPV